MTTPVKGTRLNDANRICTCLGRAREFMAHTGGHIDSTWSDTLSTRRNGGNSGPPIDTMLSRTRQSYDASGNQIAADTHTRLYWGTFSTDSFLPSPVGESFVRSYFDAAERMRVSQRTNFFRTDAMHLWARTHYQEYFYDALGRRVAMRSQRDSDCTDGTGTTPALDCLQTMDRFVWDGDQLLGEFRATGQWGSEASTLNQNFATDLPFFGAVRYGYALGLLGPDTPIEINSSHVSGAIIPEASWRGNYEAGVAPDGTSISSMVYNWPGQQTGIYLAPDARIAPIIENAWIGNIVEGKADPSGLVYDRNRYYDPTAGRFTQEDPIGLAGGANLYGYANGDPANNSDPFGLSTDCTTAPSLCLAPVSAAAAGAAAAAAVGAAVVVVYQLDQAFGPTQGTVAGTPAFAPSDATSVAHAQSAAPADEGSQEPTAGEIISKEKQGSINRRFPEQYRGKTRSEIDEAARGGDKAAKTARKLLTDKRFNKP